MVYLVDKAMRVQDRAVALVRLCCLNENAHYRESIVAPLAELAELVTDWLEEELELERRGGPPGGPDEPDNW